MVSDGGGVAGRGIVVVTIDVVDGNTEVFSTSLVCNRVDTPAVEVGSAVPVEPKSELVTDSRPVGNLANVVVPALVVLVLELGDHQTTVVRSTIYVHNTILELVCVEHFSSSRRMLAPI